MESGSPDVSVARTSSLEENSHCDITGTRFSLYLSSNELIIFVNPDIELHTRDKAVPKSLDSHI